MPRKKQTNNKNNTEQINLNGNGKYRILEVANIVPSAFEPQVKRREHFTDDDIAELAVSIEQNELIEPIIVRPMGDGFEIVAGERRWLAIKHLGRETIESVVRDLSDASAIEIQMEENLQRKQPEPLDEAYSYQFLMDKANYSVKDLSLKFGRPEKNIAQKLKLNDLSEDGKQLLSEGILPLGHAVEIAKYPAELQKTLIKKGALGTKWMQNPETGKYGDVEVVRPFVELKDYIRREVLQNLQTAPFSKSSKELRADGLACVNCPKHTGADINASLFDEPEISKTDNCLDKKCFTGKIEKHIELKRNEAAERENVSVEAIRYLSANYQLKYKDEETLRDWQFQRIEKKNLCTSAERGIWIDGNENGLVISFCKNKECEIHWNTAKESDLTPEEVEETRLRNLEKKQDNFEENLARLTRDLMLTDITKSPDFNKKQVADKEFWVRLASVFYDETYGWGNIEEFFGTEIVKDDDSEENPTGYEDSFRSLTVTQIIQILYFRINDYGTRVWNLTDISPIKRLAEQNSLDYKLFEAKALIELAPAEFKDQAAQYHDDFVGGKSPQKPCFWFEKDYENLVEDLELEEDSDEYEIDENDLGETSQG